MKRVIEKRILNEKEAAEYLGIGLTKFRSYDSKGYISRLRYPENSSKRYDILELDSWIDKLKSNGSWKS